MRFRHKNSKILSLSITLTLTNTHTFNLNLTLTLTLSKILIMTRKTQTFLVMKHVKFTKINFFTKLKNSFSVTVGMSIIQLHIKIG